MLSLLTKGATQLLALLLGLVLCTHCTQERVERQILESRLVVLILPQFDVASQIGNSLQTPDDKHGFMDEFAFWYEYSYYIKKSIEEAGYECIIVNHGAIPNDTRLLPYSKLSDIVHLQVTAPEKPAKSTHHSKLSAIGMSSINYALTQEPACILILRHHEYEKDAGWATNQHSTIFCNSFGGALSGYITRALNRRLMNNALPNRGNSCAIVRRENPNLRDSALLASCDKSFIPAAIPAVVFLNNEAHVSFISQHQNAIYFAQCIAQGIVNYMQSRS